MRGKALGSAGCSQRAQVLRCKIVAETNRRSTGQSSGRPRRAAQPHALGVDQADAERRARPDKASLTDSSRLRHLDYDTLSGAASALTPFPNTIGAVACTPASTPS